MEIEQEEVEVLTLNIQSVQLRQNISREMHKLYGFDSFILDFDLDPEDDEFII